MIDKAPDAYRTISEVAEDLDLPQHVLRFWETRFGQIKPLKRGGGRRYYRPDDVELLKGIRHLLYNEGYTIKGVQRILKDQGPRAVQAVAAAAEGRVGTVPSAGPLGMPAGHVDEGEESDAPSPAFENPAVAPAQAQVYAVPHAPVHERAPPPPLTGSDLFTSAPMMQKPAVPQPPPLPLPPAAGVATPAPQPQSPHVSFTRGGLRPQPRAETPAEPSALQPKRPRIVIQPLESPEGLEDSAISAPESPVGAMTNGHPAAGLSETSRRALQAALVELLECRRAIDRMRARTG